MLTDLFENRYFPRNSLIQIVIQEKLKISAENGVYSGVWEVPESGILIVELSNAHSRFTGKTVKWNLDFI